MIVELPGLFDLQVNGFAGVDFNAPRLESAHLAEALQRIRESGVTRCLPTLITSPLHVFAASARVIAGSADETIAGIHMEGPYLSPEDGPRGAHPRQDVIAASVEDFERRQEAAIGRIRLVTLAPEARGALELIEYLVSEGVRVALGHTAATPQQIADAVAAGASLATHLGNGCAQMLPRHPNAIWSMLAADHLAASFIVDGHHLPAEVVKVMVRAKGPTRSMLVTDATAAAGSSPGRYALGAVIGESSADGRVSLPGTPYLAGSSLTLPAAIGHTVRCTGLPLEMVIPMASTIPAAYMGTIAVGTIRAEWDAVSSVLEVKEVSM